MLSLLSDSQKAVVETMVMRLSTRESLIYLKEHGNEMSESKYFRNKRKIERMKQKRLCHFATIGFELQHLERIDQLQVVSKEMWNCYHDETQPLKKAQILVLLAQLQPYLSQYYEATKGVMNQSVQNNIKSLL